MKEMTQLQIENPPTSEGRPAENDENLAKLARAMRRALKRAANYAMRHDNAAEAANQALALLRAEFVWRFELLRSRQRQPALIVPKPMPPVTATGCSSRVTASNATSAPTTSSVIPFAWADSTSARLNPNVHAPDAGRLASRTASRLAARAPASHAFWALR